MHQKYLHASTFLVNLSLRLLIICMKMFGVTETFFTDIHASMNPVIMHGDYAKTNDNSKLR